MKLWAVNIERTIMVMAESETDAEQLANESEREECINYPDFVSARECKYLGDVPKIWRDCIPYGSSDDRNCQQIIEKVEPFVHGQHSSAGAPTK